MKSLRWIGRLFGAGRDSGIQTNEADGLEEDTSILTVIGTGCLQHKPEGKTANRKCWRYV